MKRSAATLCSRGQHLTALRLYDAVVVAAPLDFDARRSYLEALADDREIDNQLVRAEDAAPSDERVLI